MIIYGAGMGGLLTANMLRRYNPIIKEGQPSLPNNHDALLRFRSDKVAIATGIPFKKVKVSKAIKYEGKLITKPDLFLSNKYSLKVTGAYYDRSISNLEPVHRYIAPLKFISLMANSLNIEYNEILNYEACNNFREPILSTIPMPTMMKIISWPNKPDFKFKTIWSKRAVITNPKTSLYQTVYYPSDVTDCYRVSITGNVVMAEYISRPTKDGSDIFSFLKDDFGVKPYELKYITVSEMKYGKLLPIEEKVRKEFILYLTQKYNIFSVGRFATWRQLLLDDIVDDINVIDNMIGDNYLIQLHSKKGI
jgi:hypothetical protein|tara:strand:+ start:50 stop:970 length:921 start_codon:yes stop_codon:yes gene_type:complete